MKHLLADYKMRIDRLIDGCTFEDLTRPCLYALQNGGKRFRPAILYMVSEALGGPLVDNAALGIEFFHTASLIADDLPCMDNDDERRNKPSLHRAFDEKTALLATYALIAEGYDRMTRDASPQVLPLVIQQVSKGSGVLGATGGQYLDLMPDIVDEKGLLRVLYLKTGALFEISFVVGWLLGGGEPEKVEEVRQAAYHFGLAFQIADDLDDYEEDVGRLYNYARFCGKEQAEERVQIELKKTGAALKELRLDALYGLVEAL